MGWADLLGPDNGLQQFVASNRGKLGQIGAGLASGQNFAAGLANGVQAMPQGQATDDAYATAQKAEKKRTDDLNMTVKFLQDKFPDLVPYAQSGRMDEAWGEAMRRLAPKAADPFTLGAGDVRYDGSGNIIAQGGAAKPTSSMQEYDFARGQGYQGTFQQYETDMKKAGATSIDFNQNQGVAAGFADRMAAADAILADPKLTAAQTDVVQQGMGGIPGVGNFITSEDKKLADQAQRDFVNAILRRESGAAIAPSEFDNASKQYFPQPGDTPAVIKQKANNRKIALQGVTRAAGPSYQPPPSMGANGVVDFSTYFGSP